MQYRFFFTLWNLRKQSKKLNWIIIIKKFKKNKKYVSFLIIRKIKYCKKNYSYGKYILVLINKFRNNNSWEKKMRKKFEWKKNMYVYFLFGTDGCQSFLGSFKFNYLEHNSLANISLFILCSKYGKRRNQKFS